MYYLFIIIVLAVCTWLNVAMSWVGGEFLFHLFDLPSLLLILVVVVPIIVLSGLHKDFANAFRFAVGKGKAQNILGLKRAKEAMVLASRAVVGTGIFSACIGIMISLYNCDDLAALGPNIAVSVITVFYAAISYLLFLPIRSKLEIQIVELMHE